MSLLEMLFVVTACMILIAFGSGVTYLLLRQSRIYDIKVLNNLYKSLEQAQHFIVTTWGLKTNTSIPYNRDDQPNFRSRTDEDEAAIEDARDA